MGRTTYLAVSKITKINTSITTDAAPFIEAANFLVTKLCSTATDEDGDLYHDATSLELVERWLAAHFYRIRDPEADTKKAGPVTKKDQYKVDLALDQTRYGQQAMAIDISGELASWNEDVKSGDAGKEAIFHWIGTDPDDL